MTDRRIPKGTLFGSTESPLSCSRPPLLEQRFLDVIRVAGRLVRRRLAG